jgi:hypothetical protein
LAGVRTVLKGIRAEIRDRTSGRYRPERYYMRGPGPAAKTNR